MKVISFTSRFFAPLAASIFFASVVSTMAAATAAADDVFSWTDASGRKVFGSKPPATAAKVAPVKKITLGRYSSDKVIRSLGKSVQSRSSKGLSGSRGVPDSGPPTSFDAVALEAGDITLKRDDQQRVIECSVAIKNLTPITAGDVSVAFEFPDGTLVPAVGPNEVAGQSEQQFGLPKELIPLKLKLKPEDAAKMGLPPRVIVHGFAVPGSIAPQGAARTVQKYPGNISPPAGSATPTPSSVAP